MIVHPNDKLSQIVGWLDIQHQYDWYRLIGRVVRPTSFLEIGVAAGYSSYAILEGCEDAGYLPAEVVWIDWCDGHGRDGNHEYALGLIRGRFGIEIDDRIINSREIQSFHRPFELIHVDGDHRYDGCFHDANLAARHLAPNGAIVFHDTNDPAVSKAVNDLLSTRNDLYLIDLPQMRCGGQIVVRSGDDIGQVLVEAIATFSVGHGVSGLANHK